jgi:putative phosphoesterase
VRVAALYDVHGNLPALEAVLADVEREHVDAIVCGGDIVSGPFPVEVFDRLAALPTVQFVRGNVECDVLARVEAHGAARAAEALGRARLREVARWPRTIELDVHGLGRVLFCHATPRSDDEIFTRITPDAEIADAFPDREGVAVVGHTHVQFDRSIGGLRVVNPGSVGMPYEGRRGAFWALLGRDVSLRHTAYDIEAAADAIRTAGAEELAGWLLDPPDPDEVTEYFERQRGA